jgi:hypothetical protein
MLHGKLLVTAAALLVVAGAPADYAQSRAAEAPPFGFAPGRPGEWPALSVVEGRNAPEYVRLFAPSRAHTDAYQAYVSPLDLGTVLRQLERDPLLLHPPGAWTPSALLPSDAFGQTGSYERSKMARLYGARRATVARGPRGEGGRPTQAWTLISPYPDRTLERLEPGTLLIVLDLSP